MFNGYQGKYLPVFSAHSRSKILKTNLFLALVFLLFSQTSAFLPPPSINSRISSKSLSSPYVVRSTSTLKMVTLSTPPAEDEGSSVPRALEVCPHALNMTFSLPLHQKNNRRYSQHYFMSCDETFFFLDSLVHTLPPSLPIYLPSIFTLIRTHT